MIQHASIYDRDRRREDDGLRVLVMRQWPRGVRKERIDLWLKDAAPSRELLRAYTHGELTWGAFEKRYRSEMLDERADVVDHLRELEREHGVVTLLCYERIPPYQHCHRQVLLNLLDRAQAAPSS